MQDNGANATGEELDTIVNYLATNFGNGAADDKINVNTATAGDIEQGLGLSTKAAAALSSTARRTVTSRRSTT